MIASVRSLEKFSLDGHKFFLCRRKHYEGNGMEGETVHVLEMMIENIVS